MKLNACKVLTEPVKVVREQWHARILNFLLFYSSHCTHTSGDELGQLPLLALAAMKQAAFSLSGVTPDARVAAVARIMQSSVLQTFLCTYPRIYRVDTLLSQTHRPGTIGPTGLAALPTLVPASGASLQPNGCFLLDNGEVLYLLVGADISTYFLEQVSHT